MYYVLFQFALLYVHMYDQPKLFNDRTKLVMICNLTSHSKTVIFSSVVSSHCMHIIVHGCTIPPNLCAFFNFYRQDMECIWKKSLDLTIREKVILTKGMLSDRHMHAANKPIAAQFPHIQSLQSTLLSQTSFTPIEESGGFLPEVSLPSFVAVPCYRGTGFSCG